MEQQSTQTKKFILNYGLLFGLASVVLGVVMYVTNAHVQPHWGFAVLTYALFIFFVVWGIRAFKTENEGFLSLGQAIKIGIGIALIAALITSVWSLLLSEVLQPDYMDQMMEVQREAMLEQNPNMTEEQLAMAEEWGSKFQAPWIMIPVSIIGNVFIGLIISLIAGLVMRQKRPYEV